VHSSMNFGPQDLRTRTLSGPPETHARRIRPCLQRSLLRSADGAALTGVLAGAIGQIAEAQFRNFRFAIRRLAFALSQKPKAIAAFGDSPPSSDCT
jgi:hypothetical protein